MKSKSTYTGAWDFTNDWDIDATTPINDGFPYLRNNAP